MLKEFRDFLMRGNVVDLAVAVVIGAAFGVVVTALVKDLITPIIAAIIGKPDFSAHEEVSEFLEHGFDSGLRPWFRVRARAMITCRRP